MDQQEDITKRQVLLDRRINISHGLLGINEPADRFRWENGAHVAPLTAGSFRRGRICQGRERVKLSAVVTG